MIGQLREELQALKVLIRRSIENNDRPLLATLMADLDSLCFETELQMNYQQNFLRAQQRQFLELFAEGLRSATKT